MKRCLAVDVLAVDVDFFVVEESDRVVHVTMIDGVEHDVLANLFDLANHF